MLDLYGLKNKIYSYIIKHVNKTHMLETAVSEQKTPIWTQPAIIGIGITTFIMILWTLFVRSATIDPNFSPDTLGSLKINPYTLGFGVTEFILPIVLLFGLSRTALFREAIEERLTQRRTIEFILVFMGIQTLFLIYRFILNNFLDDLVILGYFTVIVAGLVGGWRVGLAVGIFFALASGYVDWIDWQWNDNRTFAHYFEFGVLKSTPAVMAVWIGSFSGLWGNFIGKRRYNLQYLLPLPIIILVLAVIFSAISTYNPYFYVDRLLTNIIINLVGFGLLYMMVRSIQDELLRQEAEAAQSELVNTNLTLTKTRLALAQAELRALQAQINPHFFFNSLNTINYFIRIDPDKARNLLGKLSEIFQQSLSAGEFITLKDEIHHVEAYLALEKARLDERLNIVWTTMSKAHSDMLIPTLILQPLVENAIVHGIAPKPEGGNLHIVINEVGQDLLFQVSDDGMGFDVNRMGEKSATLERKRPSIGTSNVDERLRLLYGEAYRLQIESEPGEGTKVLFRIPIDGQGDTAKDENINR
ncbi:MAG: histidine kinase [Chloroflexota bacterium]